MIDNFIKKLEKEGKLAAQKVGIVQIEALLKESIIDLKESKTIRATKNERGIRQHLEQ